MYTLTVGTGTGSGTVGVSLVPAGITDAVGNPPVPVIGPTITIDRQAPLPESFDHCIGTARVPLDAGHRDLRRAGYRVRLIRRGSDNGTARLFTILSASVYAFEVVPIDVGPVSVSVMAGAAVDAAGNPNQAAAPLTRTFPPLAPTVTLLSPAPPRPTDPSTSRRPSVRPSSGSM